MAFQGDADADDTADNHTGEERYDSFEVFHVSPLLLGAFEY